MCPSSCGHRGLLPDASLAGARMKCAIGCSEQIAPAIGIANLKGLDNSPCAGTSGQYPLCYHHINMIRLEKWGNVTLLGWEPLPPEMIAPEPAHNSSWPPVEESLVEEFRRECET